MTRTLLRQARGGAPYVCGNPAAFPGTSAIFAVHCRRPSAEAFDLPRVQSYLLSLILAQDVTTRTGRFCYR